MSTPLSDWLELAIEVALASGDLLARTQDKLAHIRSKSCDNDLVTEADEASERLILSRMTQVLPDHSFLAEESGGQQRDSDFVWAIDPLDGTVNYAHQLPFYCVSIGLLYQGRPVLGVIHAPALNETYTALAGGGAFRNRTPIRVSAAAHLKDGLLATGFPYRRAELPDNNYREFLAFSDRAQDLRRPGAAALDLAYVACGRFDGFWEHHLHPWDMVAGAALVSEAGGRVSGYDGEAFDALSGRIVASNGGLHAEMLALLQQTRKDIG